jgi:hypothetical protein
VGVRAALASTGERLWQKPAGDLDRLVHVEIYVYDELPDPPTELGTPLGSAAGLPAEPRIDLQGAEGRFVLVWFTSLPPDGNRFRIRLTDTRIEAG